MGSGLAGEGRGLGEDVARLHWEGQVLAKEQGALQGEEQCFKRDRAAGLLWRLRSCGEGAWAFCAGEGLLGSIAASSLSEEDRGCARGGGGCSEAERNQIGKGMCCGRSGVSPRRLRLGKNWMVLGKKGLCWEGSG